VQVEKVQEPPPAAKGVRGPLKRLRRRPKSQLVLNVRGRPIADETLDSWVDEAKAEVAADWGKT
jgi:hypothetical protein